MSRTVGIRELRQNLSRYTARTALGESFEVTDRGREVGRLVPPSTGETWLDALVAQGLVQPARHRSPGFPPAHVAQRRVDLRGARGRTG